MYIECGCGDTALHCSVVCRKASLKIEPRNLNMTEEEQESYEGDSCDKVKKKSGRWDKVSKSLHTIA